MSSVWNQDAFIYASADKIRDPLATADPERCICQSHKLVRVALNLVRYSSTSLGDGDGYGPVGAYDAARLSVRWVRYDREQADHCSD